MNNENTICWSERFNKAITNATSQFLYESFTKETRDQMIKSIGDAIASCLENRDPALQEGIEAHIDDNGQIAVELPINCVEMAEAVRGKPIEALILEAEAAGDDGTAHFYRSLKRADNTSCYGHGNFEVSFEVL